MKKAMILIIIFVVCACTNSKEEVVEEVTSNKYVEITGTFSLNDFEVAKAFILNNGNKETYRSFDGNNPHYSFNGFEAYLNAEIGQKNINNDPTISDFNEITIRDRNADPQYYIIHIVRKGDSANKDINTSEGMKEGKVYLLNPYEDDITLMKKNLTNYLETIKKECF